MAASLTARYLSCSRCVSFDWSSSLAPSFTYILGRFRRPKAAIPQHDDVLAYIAFALSPITREERVSTRKAAIMSQYDDKVQAAMPRCGREKASTGRRNSRRLPTLPRGCRMELLMARPSPSIAAARQILLRCKRPCQKDDRKTWSFSFSIFCSRAETICESCLSLSARTD